MKRKIKHGYLLSFPDNSNVISSINQFKKVLERVAPVECVTLYTKLIKEGNLTITCIDGDLKIIKIKYYKENGRRIRSDES